MITHTRKIKKNKQIIDSTNHEFNSKLIENKTKFNNTKKRKKANTGMKYIVSHKKQIL